MAFNDSNITNINQVVIDGWNKKRTLSSLQLSQIRPFIDLIALYSDKDLQLYNNLKQFERVSDFNKRVTSNLYIIHNENSGTLFGKQTNGTVNGVPIAKLESQIQSYKYSGGVSIDSLQVERGTSESFNLKTTLKVYISDPDIVNNVEFNSLLTLNKLFIISYGWAGLNNLIDITEAPSPYSEYGNRQIFDFSPKAWNPYWCTYLAKLYKFDWSFDSFGKLEGTLEFIAPQLATLMFLNSIDIRGRILGYLEKPETLPISKVSGYPYWKNNEKVYYVSLQWFIEVILLVIKENNEDNFIKIKLADITENSQNSVEIALQNVQAVNSEQENNTVSYRITNVGGIPIIADKLKGILNNNMPILDLIKEVISNHAAPGVELSVRNTGNDIEIFLLSVDLFGIATKVYELNDASLDYENEKRLFTIMFGEKNSLCESIDMSSKLDPNAYDAYQMPAFISGNQVNMFDLLKQYKLATNNEIIELITDQSVRTFVQTRLSSGYTMSQVFSELMRTNSSQTSLLTSALQRFYLKDIRKYSEYISIINNNDNMGLFSTLLGFYLKRTNLVIHGTCNLYTYNYIHIKNLLKSMGGLYNIVSVTDQVDNTNFTTTLECTFLHPTIDPVTGVKPSDVARTEY